MVAVLISRGPRIASSVGASDTHTVVANLNVPAAKQTSDHMHVKVLEV
jgi:hypothetical protein